MTSCLMMHSRKFPSKFELNSETEEIIEVENNTFHFTVNSFNERVNCLIHNLRWNNYTEGKLILNEKKKNFDSGQTFFSSFICELL